MRKELIWAAVIGISLGLIIAFGAWRVNSSLKSKNIFTTNTPRPKAGSSEFQIVLAKPENNDVVAQGQTTVSGITKSLAWLTISGEEDDYVIQADENGTFTQDVNLIPGVNQIKVTAFDREGNQSIEKVLVVYSSSFQTKTSTTTSSDATNEASIRQKVAAKVEELFNKPKAYIGTVTDITDSTIQIKTTDSQIKQISTASDGITVVKTSPSNKVVKLTDIAIGDFIVSMGYVNSSSVLLAQRILITDPITEPKVNSTYGTVTEVTKKILTITSLRDNKNNNITPDLKTDFESYTNGKLTKIKQANINKDDMVIFVTTQTSDSPTIRSIFIIQKAQG